MTKVKGCGSVEDGENTEPQANAQKGHKVFSQIPYLSLLKAWDQIWKDLL